MSISDISTPESFPTSYPCLYSQLPPPADSQHRVMSETNISTDVDIPFEIIGNIVDVMGDQYIATGSLKNLSFACHDFRPHARKHLFRSIRIYDTCTDGQARVQQLANILTTNPQLGENVKEPTFEKCYNRAGPPASTSPTDFHIACIILSVPKLKAFTLNIHGKYADGISFNGMSWSDTDYVVRVALLCALREKWELDRLRFYGCSGIPASLFLNLPRTLTAVEFRRLKFVKGCRSVVVGSHYNQTSNNPAETFSNIKDEFPVCHQPYKKLDLGLEHLKNISIVQNCLSLGEVFLGACKALSKPTIDVPIDNISELCDLLRSIPSENALRSLSIGLTASSDLSAMDRNILIKKWDNLENVLEEEKFADPMFSVRISTDAVVEMILWPSILLDKLGDKGRD